MTAIRAVIVEDHALVRTGLRTTLEASGIDVVAEAADGIAGYDIVQTQHPDVAVIDLGAPRSRRDRADPRAEERGLRARDRDPYDERRRRARARRAGGRRASLLREVVRRRGRRRRRARGRGGRRVLRSAHRADRAARAAGRPGEPAPSPLTPRETEVLRLVADGVGNAEIAERLHIGLGTVKGHIADLLEKLSASDRAQAAVTALRRGFIR